MENIEFEDFHTSRRLQIGCPVFGDFGALKEFHAKTTAETLPPVVTYQGGYYSVKYNRFFPYPV